MFPKVGGTFRARATSGPSWPLKVFGMSQAMWLIEPRRVGEDFEAEFLHVGSGEAVAGTM